MKTIVLHGDYSVKSYERLKKFITAAKDRNWNTVRVESASLLVENLSANSLFGNESFFILENPEGLRKDDLAWLNKNSSKISGTLVLYKEGSVGKTILSKLPKDTVIEEFKLPKIIFKFLDAFYPGNSKNALVLLHELLENDQIEFVFALLSRHLRNLFWVKTDPRGLPFPNWQIAKLKFQANRFNNGKLENIISNLSKIDIDAKTSQTDLLSSLDLLIATKLQ